MGNQTIRGRMILFSVEYVDPNFGNCIEWFETQKAAEDKAGRLPKDYHPGVYTRSIPTKNKEMVEWLNRNLNRDNG